MALVNYSFTNRTFIGENNFCISDSFGNFLVIIWGAVIYGYFTERTKRIPAQISGIFCISVQNYDLHRDIPPDCFSILSHSVKQMSILFCLPNAFFFLLLLKNYSIL